MDTLLLKIARQHQSIEWSVLSDKTDIQTGQANGLTELIELAQGKQIIAWLSAELVTLAQVDVPVGQHRHLDKILPSLLEEQLADDIEDLHFALLGKTREEKATVAIVSRQIMQFWQAVFDDAGLQLHAMLPEYYAIPWQTDSWTLSVGDELAYLRWSQMQALVCDISNIDAVLSLQLKTLEQKSQLYCYAMSEQASPQGFEGTQYKGKPLNILSQIPDQHAMTMNLLQGEFAKQSSLHKYWSIWRPVLLLAAVALAIHLVTIVVETASLNEQAKQYKNQVEKVFKQTFPDEKRVVNARVQMSQRLQKLQQGSDEFEFLNVFQQIVPAFEATKGLTLSRINFANHRNEMTLDLKAADYQQIELFNKTINTSKLTAQIGAVSGNKGSYIARVTIKVKQQ